MNPVRKPWLEKRAVFSWLGPDYQVWRRLGKKRLRISANCRYCKKLGSLAYIFATDSVGLCLLLFTQLYLEVEPS